MRKVALGHHHLIFLKHLWNLRLKDLNFTTLLTVAFGSVIPHLIQENGVLFELAKASKIRRYVAQVHLSSSHS